MSNYNIKIPNFVAEPLVRNNTRLLALLILHLSDNFPLNTRSLASFAKKLNHLLYMTNILTVSLINAIRFYKLIATSFKSYDQLTVNRPGFEKSLKIDSLKPNTLLSRFIACLSISNKTYDDSSFTNSTWSQLSKIPLQSINSLEISYLQTLDYNVFLCCFNTIDYTNWINYLSKMGQYLNVKYYYLLNVKNPIHKKSLNSKKSVVSSKKRLTASNNDQTVLLTPPYFSTSVKNTVDNSYNNTAYLECYQLPSLLSSLANRNSAPQNYTNPFFTSPESVTSNENIYNTVSGNAHAVPDFFPLLDHANVVSIPTSYDCNDHILQENVIDQGLAENSKIHNISSSCIDSKMVFYSRQAPQRFSQAACMPLPVMLPPLQINNNNMNTTTAMFNGYVQNISYKENMVNSGYYQNSTVPFSLSTSYDDSNSCNLNYYTDFNPAFGTYAYGHPCDPALASTNFRF